MVIAIILYVPLSEACLISRNKGGFDDKMGGFSDKFHCTAVKQNSPYTEYKHLKILSLINYRNPHSCYSATVSKQTITGLNQVNAIRNFFAVDCMLKLRAICD